MHYNESDTTNTNIYMFECIDVKLARICEYVEFLDRSMCGVF